MPPARVLLTESFSLSDETNLVVCPLRNHDGSACRKRCTGEKRFRSMQEHIRRAHAEHYIAKLPATEESFLLMVNTPPKERPPPLPASAPASSAAPPDGYAATPTCTHSGKRYVPEEMTWLFDGEYSTGNARIPDDMVRRPSLLPAATAAAALASLHNQRGEYEWDSDADAVSEPDSKRYKPRARVGPGSAEQDAAAQEPYYTSASMQRAFLPSSLAHSPPGRSCTLPPGSRSAKGNRARKSSVGQHARRGKHERQKSGEYKRKKASSAEPAAVAAMMGKRWEDLIDAAASATEEDSRDLTPVQPSPLPSPHMMKRTSLPPLFASQAHSYAASPLQRALTPPSADLSDLQAFPSVESGQHFDIPAQGLSDSSPTFPFPVQIYCAACRKLSVLRDSYACTECVCGLCQECVDVLISEHTRGRAPRCPRCNAIGGRFKPLQLDIR